MRYAVLFLLPYLAIFLQSTLFSFYSIKGTLPDLVLIWVVFFALIHGTRRGTGYGFLCGLLEDLYTGHFIGMNALSKGVTAYIIGHFQQKVFRENLLVGVIAVLVSTLFNSLFLFILNLISLKHFHVDITILLSVIYQSIYNMMLAAPLYVWYYNSSYSGVLRQTRES